MMGGGEGGWGRLRWIREDEGWWGERGRMSGMRGDAGGVMVDEGGRWEMREAVGGW